MTARIDGLEARGLVRRRASKIDRRSVLVRLTSRGVTLVDEAIRTRWDDANDALSALSPASRRQLTVLLREALLGLEKSA